MQKFGNFTGQEHFGFFQYLEEKGIYNKPFGEVLTQDLKIIETLFGITLKEYGKLSKHGKIWHGDFSTPDVERVSCRVWSDFDLEKITLISFNTPNQNGTARFKSVESCLEAVQHNTLFQGGKLITNSLFETHAMAVIRKKQQNI